MKMTDGQPAKTGMRQIWQWRGSSMGYPRLAECPKATTTITHHLPTETATPTTEGESRAQCVNTARHDPLLLLLLRRRQFITTTNVLVTWAAVAVAVVVAEATTTMKQHSDRNGRNHHRQRQQQQQQRR